MDYLARFHRVLSRADHSDTVESNGLLVELLIVGGGGYPNSSQAGKTHSGWPVC